jgi:hypothetical protein
MSLTEFGPFAAVFERGELNVPGHLELLHLHGPGARIVVDRIARALADGDPAQWVAALFRQANWRPHLVGAVALLLDQNETLDRELLWEAVDAGSWVIPQLVAAAVFVDSNFPQRAVARVARLCPVAIPVGLTTAQRHSATGPEGTHARSAKMLASLLSASESVPSLARWRLDCQREASVESLLKGDEWNGSGKIVTSWTSNAQRVFLERGCRLAPKAT